MLALQDRALDRRDRMRAEGRPLSWAAAPPASPAHFREGEDNAPLSALDGEPLGARFRSWRGASGRRYVFSIYSPHGCPAYSHAVMIVAAATDAGDRRALFVADTGCFPELVVAGAIANWTAAAAGIEFHVHLLANSPAARRALIADLSQAPRS